MEAPLDASNVMAMIQRPKKRTRIGYKIEDGKKIRVSRKSNEKLD